jgi:hypothetical protein
MCSEIQNPQIFQPNPESFSRAIIFITSSAQLTACLRDLSRYFKTTY